MSPPDFETSPAYLAAIVDSAEDAIISKDLSGIIRTFNPAAERLFGYRQSEVVGCPITILLPPDRRDEESRILATLRRGERIDHVETVRVTKDGRLVDVSLSVSPIRDAAGSIVGAAKIVRDVTERKRAAEALAAQREWFRVTLHSIGDAAIASDPDGYITFMNPVAERLTGWTIDEAIGQPLADVFRIINETSRAPVDSPTEKVMQTGTIVGLANHTVLISRDGSEFPIADSAAPIFDDERRILGVVLVFHDVTEQRRAEHTLAEQREWFETTLASIGDGVIATDGAGRVVFMNSVAEHLTGWRMGDARGHHCEEVFRIVNEQTRAVVENPIARVLESGAVVGLANHTVLIAADGAEHPIDDSGAPIRDYDGRIVGAVLVFRDVTQRRRSERTLSGSEARLQGIIASATDAIITLDSTQRILVFNAAAEAIFGYAAAEMLGQPLDRLLPARVRDIHRDHVEEFERTGVSTRAMGGERVLTAVRRNGEEFPIEAHISQIAVEGQTLYTVILRDVTRRKRAEAEREELLAIADRARAEAEGTAEVLRRVQRITDAIFADLPLDELLHEVLVRVQETLKIDTAVILALTSAEEEEEEALRVRATIGFDEPIDEKFRIRMGEYFAGRIAKDRQPLVWNNAGPELLWPVLRRKGVRSLAGVPLLSGERLLGTLHVGSIEPREFTREEVELLRVAAERITLGIERAARHDAERRARETAEASNRTKDEFLAMLGHELRNPLSAVRNAITTASLDESRRPRALEIARRQTDQLGRLIEDLLDVARITQGRITLRKERVALAEIIERAVESTRSFIEGRGLQLNVAFPPDPIRAEADPARLEQVFGNLLTNAGKYTDAGGRIDVTVERQGDKVCVRVRDTGVGIAPEMLPRLWDLFTQADRSLQRAQGGLGIGLTVVRRLVELHGGRVDAHSEGLGKGAEFVVTLRALPVVVEGPRVTSAPEPVPQRTARVLLVEDNPDTAESMTMLLELLGHRVRSVFDGVAALDAARANVPDVMLVDIGLPGIDGYEVARRVRRDPDLKAVILVALTGYGREEDKHRAIAAGFDYHLVKPVNPDALHGLVSRLGQQELKKPRTVH